MKLYAVGLLTLSAITTPLAAQDIPLSKILVEKEGWREVAKGLPNISFLQGGPDGGVWVNMNGAHGTLTVQGVFQPGPDVVLRRTNREAMAGKRNYAIEERGNIIHCFELGKTLDTLKLNGLGSPASLFLWPDEGHLVIGESASAYLWAVRIEKNGSFGPGDRYYSLRTKPGVKMHVAAMTMDAGYLLYACTPIGIQVFDPTGRLSGVIAAPSKDAMTAITIGGAKADELFVANGDKVYARRIQGKAAYTLKKK